VKKTEILKNIKRTMKDLEFEGFPIVPIKNKTFLIGSSVFQMTVDSKDQVLVHFSENLAVSETLKTYLEKNIHEEVDSLC
jgi:hypothetical protein